MNRKSGRVRPQPKQINKSGLVQGRKKRGYDFYMGPLVEDLFDYTWRVLGEDEFKRRVLRKCAIAADLWGEKAIAETIDRCFTQLQKKTGHIRRINLTSESRYDVIYNTMLLLKEIYPRAEPKLQQRINALERIRGRFYDNYRYRRVYHSGRSTDDAS